MNNKQLPELPSEEEILSRTVAACTEAGLAFKVIDGRLTICFEHLDWSKWPALKLRLEDLGSRSLLRYMESHDEFKQKRAGRTWKLVSAGAENVVVKVRAASRRASAKGGQS